jgi:hypothetical protein
MGLIISDAPQESLAALRESLNALAIRGSFSDRGLREAHPEQISATVPHPVFNLTLNGAREGKIEAARPTGWRYLLAVDEQVLASAETRSEGGRQVFSHVNVGPFVSGTVDALVVAERIADADERQLELRLLNVPALYLMSVWLQPSSKKGADEGVFVPIAPAPPGFEANRTYDRSQFTEALGSAAGSVPEVGRDDTQGGGG